MLVQIDESALIAAISTAAFSIIVAVLGGVWKLLGSFKSDIASHLESVDKSLEDRQEAWRQMLEAHIKSETIEFESLHELRNELYQIRADFESGYATKREVAEQLREMASRIEQIHRIVDARTQRGADPISGRNVANHNCRLPE